MGISYTNTKKTNSVESLPRLNKSLTSPYMKNPSHKKLGAQLKALDKKSHLWTQRHLKKLDKANAKLSKVQKEIDKLHSEEDIHNKAIDTSKLTLIPALLKACEEAKIDPIQYLM